MMGELVDDGRGRRKVALFLFAARAKRNPPYRAGVC